MGFKILRKIIMVFAMSLIFVTSTAFADYTPETYAMSGGTWTKNSDGNWTYIGADGQAVRNSWVKDGTSVFFIGYDGVLVKDNYATDGYYVNADGSWDQSKDCRESDVEPYNGVYEGPGNVFIFSVGNGNQDSVQIAYRQTGEVYAICMVSSVGHGCMMAWENGDEDVYDQILMSVSDDKKTLRVSFMGVTEVCTYNPDSTYTGQSSINFKSKTNSANQAAGTGYSYDGNDSTYYNEFIFPYSDSQLISQADAYYLSDTQLRIAINEIYARHGRIFKDNELKNYFESLSWYYGVYEPAEFDKIQDSLLNDIEKENIKTLVKERESR